MVVKCKNKKGMMGKLFAVALVSRPADHWRGCIVSNSLPTPDQGDSF